MVIDVYSRGDYPANVLSNFSENHFVIDGVFCASMEGFLQSLKFEDKKTSIEICKLTGLVAKLAGEERNEIWKAKQLLWWQDREYRRDSPQLQLLFNRAYNQLAGSLVFMKALQATGDQKIIHSIGGQIVAETVLTEYEFCSRLLLLRRYGEIC